MGDEGRQAVFVCRCCTIVPAPCCVQVVFVLRLLALSSSSPVNRSYLMRRNIAATVVDALVWTLDALPQESFASSTTAAGSGISRSSSLKLGAGGSVSGASAGAGAGAGGGAGAASSASGAATAAAPAAKKPEQVVLRGTLRLR
jgi:hypothetical protein